MSNALEIARRIREIVVFLVEEVAAEYAWTDDRKPVVMLRKRVGGNGLAADKPLVFQHGITIAPLGQQPAGGTSDNEDYGYRFAIALVQATWSDTLDDNAWPFAVWEQALRQRLQMHRIGVQLTGACELHTVLRPGDLPDWARVPDGVDSSFLNLTVFVREQRREP